MNLEWISVCDPLKIATFVFQGWGFIDEDSSSHHASAALLWMEKDNKIIYIYIYMYGINIQNIFYLINRLTKQKKKLCDK